MYGYERRLEKVDPEDVKVERDIGSWWHMLLAADSLDRGRTLGSLQKLPKNLKAVDDAPTLDPETAKPGEVFAVAADWWRQQTPFVQDTWQNRLGGSLPELLDSMFLRWYATWYESDIKYERPLAVELGWGRDLPSMRGNEEPNARLVGYVDEVYLDTRRNVIVCRDHKAHKSLGIMTTADDMMDSQLQFYAWGASPEITSWGLGKVAATAYDRIKTVAPKPPRITTAGRLAVYDGQPSVNGCDLLTYTEWAKGPDGDGVPYLGRKPKDGEASIAGRYQAEPAVLEKLASPASVSAWFQRTLTPLNGNLIKVHLRAAVDSSVDLALSRRRSEESGEAARNLTQACRWCDFVKLCRAEMVGGPGGEYELADMNLRQRPPRER
jgi:hypothetical protein